MEWTQGLEWVECDDRRLRVCKYCKEQAGLLGLYSISNSRYIRHICRCKGCGHYISITREVVGDGEDGESVQELDG